MPVSGTGSLIFGRLFDRFGIGLLVPLSLIAAAYAPLAFLGGFWPALLVGACLWGLGMGVQESIIPAAVAPMVSPGHRASAYGLFTGVYGIAWFAGSTAIGALFGISLTAVVLFAVMAELATIPLILLVRRSASAAHREPAAKAHY
jgi:MFS family permease